MVRFTLSKYPVLLHAVSSDDNALRNGTMGTLPADFYFSLCDFADHIFSVRLYSISSSSYTQIGDSEPLDCTDSLNFK